MFCRLLLLSVLLISRASELVAQEIGHTAGLPANGSPQFIYMERLHNKLAETKHFFGRVGGSNSGGSLLATGIEADNSMGRGVSENGFQFAGGNILQLQFTIPKQRDAESTISKAELWLFPNMQSVRPGKIDITLMATVTLPYANSPRIKQISHSWKTDEGCIPLDMTFLTKKISNYLKKHGSTETNITVTVQIEVVKTLQYDLTPEDVGLGKNSLSICQDLQARTSNTSFLVVKYYDETSWSTTNGTLSSSKHKRREAPSVESNSKVGNCSLVSMVVNLTEAYDFVVAPITKDIKDCKGNCEGTNFDRYSSHALVKERLRWITGQDESKLSVSCVPIEFEPLDLLINQEHLLNIVEFPDMIVKGCGCR